MWQLLNKVNFPIGQELVGCDLESDCCKAEGDHDYGGQGRSRQPKEDDVQLASDLALVLFFNA